MAYGFRLKPPGFRLMAEKTEELEL